MQARRWAAFALGAATLSIMGAGGRVPEGPSAALSRHPALVALGADLPRLEARLLEVAGVDNGRSLAEMLALLEAWRAGEGLTECGDPDEHDTVMTSCTLAPGGPLDGLWVRVVDAWLRDGLVPPSAAALMAGRPTPSMPESERDEVLAQVPALKQRLGLGERDLRKDILEGVIRPLGIYLGLTGSRHAALRTFVDRYGRELAHPPRGGVATARVAPLVAPSVEAAATAPGPSVLGVISQAVRDQGWGGATSSPRGPVRRSPPPRGWSSRPGRRAWDGHRAGAALEATGRAGVSAVAAASAAARPATGGVPAARAADAAPPPVADAGGVVTSAVTDEVEVTDAGFAVEFSGTRFR